MYHGCIPYCLGMLKFSKSLAHHGTQLRKCQHVNPYPKRADAIPQGDMKTQNEWLVSNVFNSLGNYLYCQPCSVAAFGVSRQRLAHLRKVKQEMYYHLAVDMTKEEVEEQRLGEFVIMPTGTVEEFAIWWRGLGGSTVVQDTPMLDMGMLARCHSKTSVLQDFLSFIDNNSQPNGRSQDSSALRTTFSQSSQLCRLPRLAPHTM